MQQQKSRRLEGAVALVTGGASGMGEAISILFASKGAKVVILDVNEQQGHNVEKHIQSQGGVSKFIKHDVTDPKAWKTLVSSVLATYGKIDILINNAGICPLKPLSELTLEDWRKINAVNTEGVFLGIQAVIEAMKKNPQSKGSIVNISSIAAMKGFGGDTPYSASKGAVRALTKSVAAELSGTKIRVNSIHPGFINTPMFSSFIVTLPDKGQSMVDNLKQQGIFGDPKDIAYGCLYLACDESKFVNGIELILDGGYLGTAKL